MADAITRDMVDFASNFDAPKANLQQNPPKKTKEAASVSGRRGSVKDVLKASNDNDKLEIEEDFVRASSSMHDASIKSFSAITGSVSELTRNLETSNDDKAVAGALQVMAEQAEHSDGRTQDLLQAQQQQLVQMGATLLSIYNIFDLEQKRAKVQTHERQNNDFSTPKEAEPGDGKTAMAGGGIIGGLATSVGTLLAGSWLGKKFGLFGGAGAAGAGATVAGAAPAVAGAAGAGAAPAVAGAAGAASNAAPKGFFASKLDAIKNSRIGGRVSTAFSTAGTAVKNSKGAKAGLVLGTGALAASLFAGGKSTVSEASSKRRLTENISLDEELEQSKRLRSGQPQMEGKELLSYRRNVTEGNGLIADPNTGFALNEIQSLGVSSGLFSAKDIGTTNNETIVKRLQEAKVPISGFAAANAAKDPKGSLSEQRVGLTPGQGEDKGMSAAGVVTTGAAFVGGSYLANKALIKSGAGSAIPTTARSAVAAPPTPAPPTPAPRVGPGATLTPATRPAAPRLSTPAAPRVPTPSGAAAAPAGKGFLRRAGGKAVPVLGTAMTAYDAYSIITDDEKDTKQKAKGLTNLAGGVAGAAVGAKGGAAAGAAIGALFGGVGAVPGAFIGGLIGGIGGFVAGSGATSAITDWAFGDDEELEKQKEEDAKAQAMSASVAKQNIPLVHGANISDLEVNASTSPDAKTKAEEKLADIQRTPGLSTKQAKATQGAMAGEQKRSNAKTFKPKASKPKAITNKVRHAKTSSGDVVILNNDATDTSEVNATLAGATAHINRSAQVAQSNIRAAANESRMASDDSSARIAADVQSSKSTNTSAAISSGRSNQQAIANASARQVSETEVRRSKANNVQKVMVIDNNVTHKARETKKKIGEERVASQTGTFNSQSIHPKIDDSPAVVLDSGLALLNTGFI
jgi:hypothetical protein